MSPSAPNHPPATPAAGMVAASVVAAELAAAGVSRHRAGDRDGAATLYRRALAASATDPTALHGLGVLALEHDRPADAIALLGRATAAAPERAEPYLHLGLALRAEGHIEPARAALHVSALRDPSDPRAPAAMASVLEQQERHAEAAAAAAAAVALDPAAGTPEVRATGAHALLGRHALREHRLADALLHLEAALREQPSDLHSRQELGRGALAAGDPHRAAAAFRLVLDARPDDPAAMANLGAALFELNHHREAEALLRAAVAAREPTAATLSNLGLVLMATGALREAAILLERAARLAPADDGITNNLGTVLLDLGDPVAAADRFAAVERRSPNSTHADRARFNRGTLLLAAGHHRDGWPLFESRRALFDRPADAAGLPDWSGDPLPDGRAVLLYPEQGLGDCLQFLRFVRDASHRAPVVLRLPPALHALAAPLLSPRCRLLRQPADLAACAAAAGLLSLPFLLDLGGPESTAPYLAAPPARDPADPPSPSATARRLGLHWAGSPNYRFDLRRSLPLDHLAPLADLADTVLVSLQQGDAASQPGPVLAERLPPGADLSAAATLIAGLDAVVAVDSAIAHLAGALGVPVLLLDRFGGDWRWRPGNRRPDGRSAWYPDVIPFTQPEPGDWHTPIDAITAHLRGAGPVGPAEQGPRPPAA